MLKTLEARERLLIKQMGCKAGYIRSIIRKELGSYMYLKSKLDNIRVEIAKAKTTQN